MLACRLTFKVEQRGLQQFASIWMARSKQVGHILENVRPVYDDMIAKIRSDAQTPGSWIAVGGLLLTSVKGRVAAC